MLRSFVVPMLLIVPLTLAGFAVADYAQTGLWAWAELFTVTRLMLCSGIAFLFSAAWIVLFHRLRMRWLKAMKQRLVKPDAPGAERIARRILWVGRVVSLRQDYLTPFDLLAYTANELNDTNLAVYYQQRSLAVGSGVWAERHKADVFNNLGDTLYRAQRFAEAEPFFRQALGQIDRGFGGLMRRYGVQINLAGVLTELDRLEDAEALFEQAWQDPLLREDSFSVAIWQGVRSSLLERRGQHAEALEAAQTALGQLPPNLYGNLRELLRARVQRLTKPEAPVAAENAPTSPAAATPAPLDGA